MDDMGFQTFGFAGGREDDWEPDLVYWGPETKMLGVQRFDAQGKLANPLAATVMGLIYVNPEGRTATPTRSRPPRTSARASAAWP